jgi:cytoskeletal protein CcmA (bactofilin family)
MGTIRSLRSHPLLILGLLAGLLALFAAAPARAAEIRSGNDVVIGRGEVIAGDLYVAANSVTVDGTIKGDLVAVGSQVTVNGVIEGDLLAAAQAIAINGTVRDDARAAGQAILLGPSGRVDGDLAVGGLSLENQPGSVVQGDVLVGAYQALLAGSIGRNITGGLDRLELRGSVGGDVDISVGGDSDPSAVQFSPAGPLPLPRVQPNLTLADSARIGGKLSYRSSTTAAINPSAQVAGAVTFESVPAQAAPAQPILPGLTYLQRFTGLLLVGLLLLWLAPAWTKRLADTVEARPLPSLGWGLVAFFAFIGAVLAALVLTIALAIVLGWLTLGGLVGMTLVLGLLLNAMLVTSYIAFVAYVAQIVVGYVAARWLLRRAQPAWAERQVVPLALGVLLYVVLRAIPWLGPLVGIVVVLVGLGALWQWGRATLHRPRATPAPIAGLQPA